MQRSSIALFLAATGLIAGMAGCGKAPEPSESQNPAAGQSQPDHNEAEDDKKEKESDTNEGGEGGEGGEG